MVYDFLTDFQQKSEMKKAIIVFRDKVIEVIRNMRELVSLNKLRLCILQFIFQKEFDIYKSEVQEEVFQLKVVKKRKLTRRKTITGNTVSRELAVRRHLHDLEHFHWGLLKLALQKYLRTCLDAAHF